MKRHPLLASLLLFAAGSLAGEDFRVQVLDVLTADPSSAESGRVNLSFAQGLAIALPEDRTFLAGVEIELRVPAAAQARKDSFLEYIYRGVKPLPSKSAVSYAGERYLMQVVPSRVSQILQIPLGPDSGLKPGPYATVLPPLDASAFPLVFRLMPAYKGVPEDLETAVFQVRVRPILRDEGMLRLNLERGPGLGEEARASVTVDDKPLADPSAPLLLKAGAHSLRISGDSVREEFRSFTIEEGKVLRLDVTLQDVTPRLILEYPERSSVQLDGKDLPRDVRGSAEGIALAPGDHSITFTVGDYSLTRKLAVQRGKTYRVSLLIDLKIAEE